MLLVLFKKFLGMRPTNHLQQDTERLEEKIIRIQEGDEQLLNQLITDYQPYIAKTASRFSHKYIDPARDDEYMIALHAFHEAIQKYEVQVNHSFLSFAAVVIRRRLIDHMRKEKKHMDTLPYSFETEDEEKAASHPIDVHQGMMEYEQSRAIAERQAEIKELSITLQQFDIHFHELVNVSPKHVDSRMTMFRIGAVLSRDPQMMELLLQRKTLPIKQLMEKVEVSRKTLERNRKYLIAVTLILHGNYPYLQDYLSER